MSEGVIVALVGVIGAVLGGFIQALFQHRNNDAQVNKLITDSVKNLIEPLNERIDAQDRLVAAQGKEIISLKIELKDWRECAEARGRQLERANIVPSPFVSSKGK